ncbi:plastocyanin/azurin family copper-binding protein [uncultured Sunxiuqinia sp.]|uniref:plastocyanin/azurin family copper-binding protein n=1 Tax=uncultured Sunxiuqinia sp. TaxID=1573825 RepID=UPI0030D91D64
MKAIKTVLTALLLIVMVQLGYSQPREVKIEGHDHLRYTVETIKTKPGETLKITLKTVSAVDKSQMAHNWVLLKRGTDALNFVTQGLQHQDNDFIDPELEGQIIAKTDMLGDGEVDSITFTVPEKKGEYQYVCTFRAHFQAGMKGKLIVE